MSIMISETLYHLFFNRHASSASFTVKITIDRIHTAANPTLNSRLTEKRVS